MKSKLKLCFVYLLIYLIGASIASGIRFAYNFSVVSDIIAFTTEKPALMGFISFSCRFLIPIILTFLSAFTIYSCAVSGTFTLICGARFGIMAIQYGKSQLNALTHVLSLIFLLIFAFLHIYLSSNAALYRAMLRYAAPDPKELLKLSGTSSLFKIFICISLSVIAVSLALYFFIIYFPI